MTFDQWLSFIALGEVRTTDYPAVAAEALAEGLESTAFAALAGMAPQERSPSEVQELFDRGLVQVQKAVPSRASA